MAKLKKQLRGWFSTCGAAKREKTLYRAEPHEDCMRRWIQLPLTKLKDLEEQLLKLQIDSGHHYTNARTNIDMVKLHLDSLPVLHENDCNHTILGQPEPACANATGYRTPDLLGIKQMCFRAIFIHW